MDQPIAQARVQFEQVLSYIQGEAQNQQLHEVEKGIFSSLLKIGLTLLALFFQFKGVGRRSQTHIDGEGVKRPYHSIKHRVYHSIFGKISIARACYWAKGHHEIYPLKDVKNNEKLGKKKMSTVIGVYTVAPNKRNPETFLSKESLKEDRPRPQNKVLQATLESKEAATLRLKEEVEKRDPEKKKPGVAFVDGEHKLRELIKTYLPWLIIIIDVYHVMEYLWKGAHIFHKENTPEAEHWMTDKLTRLLHGKIAEVIEDLKELQKSLSKGKQDLLQKIITYLDNGKEHMHYNIYISKGYPIGSGVVEGACKNLVKDRMEQCGMRWTIAGAEAILGMRSIQVNKMTDDYWRYHIAQERCRLYRGFNEENAEALVA